jgi:GT2 family glycosyltransferase
MTEISQTNNGANESPTFRIIALTTCHNRRKATLTSLSDLHNQALPDDVSLAITMVDDGSTDGTSEAVQQMFPLVEILHGTGSLYWAGGMRYGWNESVKDKLFDALLVFNDDIHLDKHAICELVNSSRTVNRESGQLHAVTGGFTDREGKVNTYGGFLRSSRWHPLRFKQVTPTGMLQQIDTLNMNFSLITADALRKVGFLAPYFQHNAADIEFGLRLCKAGGRVILAPSPVGWCDRNGQIGTSLESGIPTLQRWRRLISVKEQPPLQRARYFGEHGGWYWPLFWATPYLRVWIDSIFRAISLSNNRAD